MKYVKNGNLKVGNIYTTTGHPECFMKFIRKNRHAISFVHHSGECPFSISDDGTIGFPIFPDEDYYFLENEFKFGRKI